VSEGGINRPLTEKVLYLARDVMSRQIFRVMGQYSRGWVLDIGGADFYLSARKRKIPYDKWFSLDVSPDRLPNINDGRFLALCGDGCRLPLPRDRFDTVLNIQVLEHVFEPLAMIKEIGRVLKPGGHALFLIPQTSTSHAIPNYYCNFSIYWIKRALDAAGLRMVEHQALGGVWTSMASHLVYFFFQSLRWPGLSDRQENRRGFLFYPLWPFMALYALISIPLCLFFGLGDLTEEPNHHLIVVTKP